MEVNTELILQKLKRAGLKLTGKREATIDLFVNNQDKYLAAKEVYEHVRESYPNVSYDTIYRTLSTLLEEEIIEHMEFRDDAAKYRLKCHEAHHHHLVCVECGSTSPMDDCPMELLKDKISNFMVVNHRFEIYGYCQDCQA